MNCSFKDKKTGEIVNIAYYSYSSKTTVGYRDSTATKHEIPEEEFNEKFAPVFNNYHEYQTEIIEYCKSDFKLQNVLDSVLRRYHPGGYFREGDLVYLVDQFNLFYNSSYNYRDFGVNYPLKIYKIIQKTLVDFVIYVDSPNINIKNYNDCNLMFEASLNKISPYDAFWMLHRYDQPY